MRELKFRAWDVDLERIIYPDIVYFGTTNHIRCGFEIDGKYFWEDCEHFILMQYTGLKDKNGKEIYEGDIFGAKERWFKPKVRYSSNKGGFIIGNLAPEILLYDYLKDNPEFEIIGNIYENPELIKEVK